jgi:hypothetical protein
MPTKRLPSRPSLDHLKHQASDLLRDRIAGEPAACHRIREFHPRFHSSSDVQIQQARFALSDAYLAIAREYGFASWARLREHLANSIDLDRPPHERIDDPVFRMAVDLADDADIEGLRAYLSQHPSLVHRRVVLEGDNYFRNPSLLEFIAENPVRRGRLSPDVVEVAKVILESGARTDRLAMDSTLSLVCSGRVARECGVQLLLIRLLCKYGANAGGAMSAAISHGEFAAATELQLCGAQVEITAAAAMGRVEIVGEKLPVSTPEARHIALALACQHGHVEVVKLLLDAGENPDRYNPVGFHAHSTPLHQAAFAGHFDVVRLLEERGACLDRKDIHYNATPAEWAEYAGRSDIAEYLRTHGRGHSS